MASIVYQPRGYSEASSRITYAGTWRSRFDTRYWGNRARFTTTAGAWGGSYPMDMLPRCAGAAPLDFQVKEDLALCLFTERPSLSRARLEKCADENVIHYLDRAFFPLTETART